MPEVEVLEFVSLRAVTLKVVVDPEKVHTGLANHQRVRMDPEQALVMLGKVQVEIEKVQLDLAKAQIGPEKMLGELERALAEAKTVEAQVVRVSMVAAG